MTRTPLSGRVPSPAPWQPLQGPLTCRMCQGQDAPISSQLSLQTSQNFTFDTNPLGTCFGCLCINASLDGRRGSADILAGRRRPGEPETLCLHLLPLASHLQASGRNSPSGGRGTIWWHYPGVSHVSSHLRRNAISQSHLVELVAGPGPLAGSGRH